MANIIRLGGGGSATLITKSITSNGTYNASSDNADGYSQVSVSVTSSATAIPWTGYAYRKQSKRSLTVSSDDYVLESLVTVNSDCVGLVSVPVSLTNINGILLTYDVAIPTFSSGSYYPSMFWSATPVTGSTSWTLHSSTEGQINLYNTTVSSGSTIEGLSAITSFPSSGTYYLVINLGCTSFTNMRVYGFMITG